MSTEALHQVKSLCRLQGENIIAECDTRKLEKLIFKQKYAIYEQEGATFKSAIICENTLKWLNPFFL